MLSTGIRSRSLTLEHIPERFVVLSVTTNLSMYADDHQIYHTGRDQSSVTLMLKESAQQATNWYNSNLLAGNLKKYQTMNIGHGQSDNNTSQVIRLNNHDISITDSLKLLGVTIDSILS